MPRYTPHTSVSFQWNVRTACDAQDHPQLPRFSMKAFRKHCLIQCGGIKNGMKEEINPVWWVLYMGTNDGEYGMGLWLLIHLFQTLSIDVKCTFCGFSETIFHCLLECLRLERFLFCWICCVGMHVNMFKHALLHCFIAYMSQLRVFKFKMK